MSANDNPETFTIVPHAIVGPIRLDASREEVRERIGSPSASEPRRDCFFAGAVQVFYDANGVVELAR